MQRAKGKIQRISRRLDFGSFRERFESVSRGSFSAAFLTVVGKKLSIAVPINMGTV
jgi:hypothetical protein